MITCEDTGIWITIAFLVGVVVGIAVILALISKTK